MTRHSRDDVVSAAGRLFAERGYHGTSMRDLGRELGLMGSSLYAHIEGKQELLVEVIDRGAGLFRESSDRALAVEGDTTDRLRALIAGHVAVVLDHRDEVGTFLNEAAALDDGARLGVLAARDNYEAAFRRVLLEGAADGSFRSDLDAKTGSIFILSILNAIGRWYREDGLVDRDELVDRIVAFSLEGIAPSVRATV
jgi:AcrR family transcriptional regulator